MCRKVVSEPRCDRPTREMEVKHFKCHYRAPALHRGLVRKGSFIATFLSAILPLLLIHMMWVGKYNAIPIIITNFLRYALRFASEYICLHEDGRGA